MRTEIGLISIGRMEKEKVKKKFKNLIDKDIGLLYNNFCVKCDAKRIDLCNQAMEKYSRG